MNQSTVCGIIPMECIKSSGEFLHSLKSVPAVNQIFLYGGEAEDTLPPFIRHTRISNVISTENIRQLIRECSSDYLAMVIKEAPITLGPFAIERMVQVAETTGAGMVYANYFDRRETKAVPHPVIDYQMGSIRDDFNFGPLVLVDRRKAVQSLNLMPQSFHYAGLYYLRLKLSQISDVIRVPEYLYTTEEIDPRVSGKKMFDYVDPKNRKVQIEMEQAVTEHLKDCSAFLSPEFEDVSFREDEFSTRASVIIPVKNRVRTISDAVQSALRQQTDFPFNVIVVDNHSEDGTTDFLSQGAKKDRRLIHLIPERKDLQIGGCWNEGVHHPKCGMFSVQLDSDDIYSHNGVLQKIVDTFLQESCAMVIGSYQLVDFKFREIPPGLIDHSEWTPHNGRNNALRINGLGAPRAFYTPILRALKIPNVSYGEDYAIALSLSRRFRIGRIYESLYLCRRWEDNSDAAIDIEKENRNNHYKDRIRTIEFMARKRLNLKEK